ncbi:MAG: NAD(+) synthase [Lentisphaerae bacterium]|jgi:NAD+ synthase (glutamine-hydrolysing)|nr:NAD(+) synthase [Lentisphaerota bacterium]
MLDIYRIACCVPKCHVGDIAANCDEMLACANSAMSSHIVVFPELSVTSAYCGDLFLNAGFLDHVSDCVSDFVSSLPEDPVYVFGAPVLVRGRLYDCAVVVQDGDILGIVPRSFLGASKRHFSSGHGISGQLVEFAWQDEIPFGTDLVFDFGGSLRFGVEVGGDGESILSPSRRYALGGANLLVNITSSHHYVGRGDAEVRRCRSLSEQLVAAYAVCSSGVTESTVNGVCSGRCVVAECGEVIARSAGFERENAVLYADVDLGFVTSRRLRDMDFRDISCLADASTHRLLENELPVKIDFGKSLHRPLSKTPFVPEDPNELSDVFSLQVAGLCKRFEAAHSSKLILGVSGGLDSTLALLVCVRTMSVLGRQASDVIAVTMPGFGTTDRTYKNALALCHELGVELREISIKDACLQHFKDIGHDPKKHDVVYENTQARERTQILFDLANACNGLVVGTGDMSELAVGWCTYNGDHMSMYAVNSGVPKTLIRSVLGWCANGDFSNVAEYLRDVIDTPVSPELLPPKNSGEIQQKTEDIIGPYELIDFFLYHFAYGGASKEKVAFLATCAFGKRFKQSYLDLFVKRFFTHQFKRSCMPDGPQVTVVGLSPRGAVQLASDGIVPEL